jgi:hypothetical protein
MALRGVTHPELVAGRRVRTLGGGGATQRFFKLSPARMHSCVLTRNVTRCKTLYGVEKARFLSSHPELHVSFITERQKLVRYENSRSWYLQQAQDAVFIVQPKNLLARFPSLSNEAWPGLALLLATNLTFLWLKLFTVRRTINSALHRNISWSKKRIFPPQFQAHKPKH